MFERLKSLFSFSSRKAHPVVAYVERHFGFTPLNTELYITAVRHKSAHEHPNENNERLEFLGDAVLDSLASHYLFNSFPGEFEGFLTKQRAIIVSRRTLNRMAIETGLEKLVDAVLEQDPKQTSIGGNALEALIGAIYLDKGYDFTQRVFEERIMNRYIKLDEPGTAPFDPKSRLIEYSQKKKWEIRFQTGDHLTDDKFKKYKSEVWLNNEPKGTGIGTSKKKAEQEAALNALNSIDNV